MSYKYHIPYGNHASQFGELRIPKNLKFSPVIVTIHGGFWQSKYDLYENDPICEDLTRRGFTTWNIEYRRVGENGGGWPGTFNDVIAAVNYLHQLKISYPIDLENVMIIGHSAGGHLGLWLAAREKMVDGAKYFTELNVPIQKVISLAGVTDLKAMWKIHREQGIKSVVGNLMEGSPTDHVEHYAISSPMELLHTDTEQVLIHGDLDKHVPVQLSRDYYIKLKKTGGNVIFIELKDVDHFKIIDPQSNAWKKVINFI